MRKSIKHFQKLALIFCIGYLTFACSEAEDTEINEPQSNVGLSATSSANNGSNANQRVIVNGFATSQFAVGTKEIEMKYAAKADLLAGISIGNIALKTNVSTSFHQEASQPKNVILVNNGTAATSVIAAGRSPQGNYTEVNFKLHRKTEGNTNDPMYDRSLWIAGEIDGKVSTIWLTSEKAIKARSENAVGVEVDGDTDMILVFDMDKLFAEVDFSAAVDANGDGRIDIGPNSADGNAAILSKIESNLETAVVLKGN